MSKRFLKVVVLTFVLSTMIFGSISFASDNDPDLKTKSVETVVETIVEE